MKRYKLFLLLAILLPITSCSDFLDREPDQLLSDEAVFNDPKMIKSAMVDLTKPMNLQMIYGVSILTL